MSKMGRHYHDLQHRSQYKDGWETRMHNEPRDYHWWPIGSVEREAFGCGWDDADDNFIPRIEP